MPFNDVTLTPAELLRDLGSSARGVLAQTTAPLTPKWTQSAAIRLRFAPGLRYARATLGCSRASDRITG
ncbi:MAG: hypothetical protein EOP67_01265 [Sphingomonas sp.]|nr:MAG: hypothetical protein EOP67_01265 [Sphingomonas sp.]